MKKILVVVFVLVFGMVAFLGINKTQKSENVEYLRIHIRANSNSEIDQGVKYKVKDAIVEFLSPYLTQIKSKEQAEKVIKELNGEIEKKADEILKQNGFTYKSNAQVRNEKFPTRVYNELTLKSGYYDALIVELGSGKGDNWWCVVYPPLCFTGASVKYEYRSKIVEIIREFISKKENK